MSSITASHNKTTVPDVPTIVNGSMNGTTNPAQSAVTFAGGNMMGVPKPNNIQFGFPQSPAMTMNTPHAPAVDAVPSPQMPPSPIPQPSKSGGVPGNMGPGGVQAGNGRPQFGMLLGDNDHHAQVRPGFTPQQAHASLAAPTHGHGSPQTDVSNMQGGHRNFNNNRRGNFNSGHNNSPRFSTPMHYNPNHHSFQSNRGGMAPAFTPNRPAFNPSQANRSPAMPPSMPVTTPNMGQANLMPMNGQPHYYPQVGHQHQMPPVQQTNAGYPPMYMTHNYYTPTVFTPSAPQFTPQYHTPPQFQPGNLSHNMSRTPSHSERPNSSASNQQTTQQPAAQQSSVQQHIAHHPQHHHHQQQQQPPSVVSSQPPAGMVVGSGAGAVVGSGMPPAAPAVASNFVRAKRTSAITIKDAHGKVIDLSAVATPIVTPSASAADSTPASTAASKPAAPTHARTDTVKHKTTKEIQEELREKIGILTGKKKDDKPEAKEEPKEEVKEEVKVEEPKTEEPKDEAKEVKEVPKEEVKEEAKDVKQEAPVETKEVKDEPKEAAVEVVEEAKEAPVPVKEEEPKEAPVEAPKEPEVKTQEDEDEEMERMIREMEEAEAAREKAEEEHRLKKAAEKQAAKEKEEEAKKANAADEDRKLREAEREMERLEEEKERRRQEREAGGGSTSVADLLAKARSGAPIDEPEKPEAPVNPADAKPLDGHKATAQRAAKPAALNLKTLNAGAVEPPQPSAALQSLRSARFLTIIEPNLYPPGIHSPNPALNPTAAQRGGHFRYDATFLLQFQKVFTEQPSVEFGQQVKALIGDSDSRAGSSKGGPSSYSRNGSRSGAGSSAQPPMGLFNAAGSGRGPASSGIGASHMRTGGGAMSSSFGTGKPFPGSGMSRNPSSATTLPHSPSGRQASRQGTRGRGGGERKAEQDGKKMAAPAAGSLPDVKPLLPSATGWKPLSVGASLRVGPTAVSANGHLDPEMVQRKVKAALNKMTPEKFDKISDQILEIAAQSRNETDGRTLRQVIQLTFEKATDEAHWAPMYAQFCRRMLDQMDASVRDENIRDKNNNVVSGGALFRKYLLNRCQEDFERGWKVPTKEDAEGEDGDDSKPVESKPQPEAKPAAGPGGEADMLSDEYYVIAAAKRRGLGLIQFIGELFKLQMLTERIMHECVRKLVDFKGMPDEAEVESLSKLLRTIGANLDGSDKGRPVMDIYFDRIKMMSELENMPSRLKFMLMDVMDLRQANWVSKEANKGPKTLEEVRIEAEAQQAAKAQETARNSARGAGGSGRPPMGRQDARGAFAAPPSQANTLVSTNDLNQLRGSGQRIATRNSGFGGSGMFGSRNNSNRRTLFGSSSRHGDDSNSSRAGTPGGQANQFDILGDLDADNPGSPPSVNASPALVKATPTSDDKQAE